MCLKLFVVADVSPAQRPFFGVSVVLWGKTGRLNLAKLEAVLSLASRSPPSSPKQESGTEQTRQLPVRCLPAGPAALVLWASARREVIKKWNAARDATEV